METVEHREKEDKSETGLSGYELGAGIRKAVEEKARSTGNALNSLQHRIGVRVTSFMLAIIWLAAFYYFAHLLLPFI